MGWIRDVQGITTHTVKAAAAAVRGDEAGTQEYLAAAGGSDRLPDDGKRYTLTYPRGIDRFADNLRPDADTHTISVYGTADLQRRLAEAEKAGVQVSHRDITDDDVAEA